MKTLTFVSCHRLEKVEGNVRRTTNHGFKFITTEERQQWNWNNFCHAFPNCRHLLVKLMKPAIGKIKTGVTVLHVIRTMSYVRFTVAIDVMTDDILTCKAHNNSRMAG
jgi:hypothetical protein